LSDLLNDILTAARSGDHAALKSQIENTKIPDYQNWFVRVYGEKRGHSLADFYGEWWERREHIFIELFLHLAHQEGRIVVQPFNFNEIHPSPLLSFDAYLADWEEPGATSANMVAQIGYFFIFVDGRFRWDCILQRHSDVVEHPRCLHMPSPPYPREANGAQGVVLINAVVNEDGSVTVQNVEKGRSLPRRPSNPFGNGAANLPWSTAGGPSPSTSYSRLTLSFQAQAPCIRLSLVFVPVLRKNSTRFPSGTYLFGFPALENPRSQPCLAENTSQPG
jgi:hypothetical protein